MGASAESGSSEISSLHRSPSLVYRHMPKSRGADMFSKAVRTWPGGVRRTLWRVGVRVMPTRTCNERSVRETGHLSTRARDSGTAICLGDAISASVR